MGCDYPIMRRTAVYVGLLLAAVVLVGAAAGGVAADVAADEDDQAQENASMGAEISSFMQASAKDAESDVDDGMFGAAMANAAGNETKQEELLTEREARLEERHQRLDALRASIDADEHPAVANQAKATGVSVGAANLERSVNGTQQAAEAAGLDTENLETLRTNASELAGPDIAELARGLVGTPHDDGDHPGAGAPGLDDSDDGFPGQGDGGPPDDDGDVETAEVDSDDDDEES